MVTKPAFYAALLRNLNLIQSLVNDYICWSMTGAEADKKAVALVTGLSSISEGNRDMLVDALIASYWLLPRGTKRDAPLGLKSFELTRESVINILVREWDLVQNREISRKIMFFFGQAFDPSRAPPYPNPEGAHESDITIEFVRRAILREVRNAIPIRTPSDYEAWILMGDLPYPIRELFAETRARAGGLELAIKDILNATRVNALEEMLSEKIPKP